MDYKQFTLRKRLKLCNLGKTFAKKYNLKTFKFQ